MGKKTNRNILFAMCIFLLSMVSTAVVQTASAAVIYSSYPHRGVASAAVTLVQHVAVQFTPTESYFLDRITIPFTLLGSTQPLPVEIQLWDNKLIQVGIELRGRPDSLIASWTSNPITALGHFHVIEPVDVIAEILEQPILMANKSYWIKVVAGSSSMNAQWGGSVLDFGPGQHMRIVTFSDFGPADGENLDPGNFLAFQVEGNLVPEPVALEWVTISEAGFTGQMSKYETTNAQYCQFLNEALASGDITVSGNDVLGANGSNSGTDYVGELYYDGDGPGWTDDGATNGGAARINYSGGVFSVDSGFEDHPVSYVSWYGATAFCNYYGYRLPTEWEWQAVADYDGSFTYGCGTDINNSIANYRGSTHPDGTTVVGSFGVSGYGVCDMAGNIQEWVSSPYGVSMYHIRGGCWYSYGYNCTVSFLNFTYPHITGPETGFRVARTAEPAVAEPIDFDNLQIASTAYGKVMHEKTPRLLAAYNNKIYFIVSDDGDTNPSKVYCYNPLDGLSNTVNHTIVAETTGKFVTLRQIGSLLYFSDNLGNVHSYDGSTLTEMSGTPFTASDHVSSVEEFNGLMYFATSTGNIFRYNGSAFEQVCEISDDRYIWDMAAWQKDGYLYVSVGPRKDICCPPAAYVIRSNSGDAGSWETVFEGFYETNLMPTEDYLYAAVMDTAYGYSSSVRKSSDGLSFPVINQSSGQYKQLWGSLYYDGIAYVFVNQWGGGYGYKVIDENGTVSLVPNQNWALTQAVELNGEIYALASSAPYDSYGGSVPADVYLITTVPEPAEPDSDGDGIPDEEDPDDDNDGFNDWLEELIGTDPIDENSVPDLDDIKGTTISFAENLVLAAGKEKSLVNKIEKIRQVADDVIESATQVLALLNDIDALYNSERISFEDLHVLKSLAMKFLPLKEGIYTYEFEDGYIKHKFRFNEEQMIEMAESPFKAQPYANWMIDKIWTIADGMGANLGKATGRFILAFKTSSMANAALEDEWDEITVQIRSRTDEEGKWALRFLDAVADKWKDLTGK